MKPFLLALPLMALAASVSAASLDFSTIAGSQGASVAVPGGATITHEAGNGVILVGPGAASQADGFCFLMGSSCEAGGTMDFDFAITDLTFDIDGWQSGDSVTISAFLGATFLVAGTFDTGDQVVNDFASLTLDRLVFADNSTAAGVGYSTFEFNRAQPVTPAIPLPASAVLMLGGLGALAAFGRRRAAG